MKKLLTINGRKAFKRYVRSWFVSKPLSYSELSDRVVILSFVAGVMFCVLLFSLYA